MHENRETSEASRLTEPRPVRKGVMPYSGQARFRGVGLRYSTDEPAEQEWATAGGGWGGKTGDQGEHRAT